MYKTQEPIPSVQGRRHK